MEITPKAMEIEYIHIKRFNLEIEKAYAIGLTAIHIHSLPYYRDWETDRKSTRLNSSHITRSRMPSSA